MSINICNLRSPSTLLRCEESAVVHEGPLLVSQQLTEPYGLGGSALRYQKEALFDFPHGESARKPHQVQEE